MKQLYIPFFIFLLCFTKLAGKPLELSIEDKIIMVDGKQATVLALTQPDGTLGVRFKKGETFDVVLKNSMKVPTSIHWHGLILPNNQDGVAFVTQFPLYPGSQYHYQFPLVQSGTYWMHSHYGLQEQKQLSAPLIIYSDNDDINNDQETIIFLSDFSFRAPEEIYQSLRCNKKEKMSMSSQDIVEVDYDAFLVNYRPAEESEVVKVKPGIKIRLRIINGASATNFFVDLGKLEGELIAVDGNRVQSIRGKLFEIAVAQRMDIIVTIPETGDLFPILAIGEGTDKQAGIMLATKDLGKHAKLSSKATTKAGAFTNRLEGQLRALYPLEKKAVDNKLTLELGGNMSKYIWTINGQSWPEVTPQVVGQGQRVEVTFKNSTTMSHPMHLHGHVFQVTAINGVTFRGAMRDTILVMPNETITIQFDANNPGVWPLHCHILYHLEAGMFTVLRYNDFVQPLL